MMIAALYVQPAPRGCYHGLPGVDAWDEARDARKYAGPYPTVCHPPCQRWGRYWYGGPSCKVRKKLGDDDGCFEAALAAVRRWGGVLEHPEASAAWRAFGLIPPMRGGGWSAAGDGVGWTCCVEQGHYGHRARKATWLYAAHVTLPALTWGSSSHIATSRVEGDGFHTAPERAAAMAAAAAIHGFTPEQIRTFRRLPKGASPELRADRNKWLKAREQVTGRTWCGPERMARHERSATPTPFRDLLISIARTAVVPAEAGEAVARG